MRREENKVKGGIVVNVGGNEENNMLGNDQEVDVHVGGIFLYPPTDHPSCST